MRFGVFFKLIVKGAGGGIGTTLGGRIVGCAVTDVNDTYLNTMTGFVASPAGRASGAKIYGNYLYECGYDGMYSQVHTIYIYNRSGNEIDPPEIAWNYLKNNMANHGINFYDEGYCGNYTSAVNIHHNVLENQSGLGIHVQSVDTGYGAVTQDADVNVYSNLLIEPGQGPDYAGDQAVWAMGVSVAGDQLNGTPNPIHPTHYLLMQVAGISLCSKVPRPTVAVQALYQVRHSANTACMGTS